MKRCIFLLSSIIIIHGCRSKIQSTLDIDSLTKEEHFFGQKAPGLIPELFALNSVSTNHLEIEAAVSPDMKEFYFIRQKEGEAPKSHLLKFENSELIDTEVDRPSGEVFISTDNQIMYLGNNYRERTPTGWTEEKSIGAPFDEYTIMRLSASSDKTYFFDERDSIGTIRFSSIVGGQREPPKDLEKHINSGVYTAHPFIAQDKSYLIWDSEREDGYGGSDLYISFRQADDSWGPAINMGKEINSDMDDTYGSITSDGKYFFFNRVALGQSFADSQANIYWVNAEVVMNLKD